MMELLSNVKGSYFSTLLLVLKPNLGPHNNELCFCFPCTVSKHNTTGVFVFLTLAITSFEHYNLTSFITRVSAQG